MSCSSIAGRRIRLLAAAIATSLVVAPSAAHAATLPDIAPAPSTAIAPSSATAPSTGACGAEVIVSCVPAGPDGAATSAAITGLSHPTLSQGNRMEILGPQTVVSQTTIEGQAGPKGQAVVCNVGLATGTPAFYRGNTRGISYSGSVFCPNGNARDLVTMHITAVTLKDAVTNQTLANAPSYGPYVIAANGGTTGGSYTRTSDTQTEYLVIQAYLDITSGTDGSSNGWHVVPPACTQVSRFRVRCDFNSGAFGFVPNNVPSSTDDLQAILDAGDARTDAAIDQLVNLGVPYATIVDGLIDPPVNSTYGQIQTYLFGISPGAAYKALKCAASIGALIVGDYLLVSKVRKLGGVVKVAKRIVLTRDREAAAKAFLAGIGEFTGVSGVIDNCT